MTQPIHIMLDLETWGTDPGRDLRSIGACVFDPDTGTIANGDNGTFYQNVENPIIGNKVDGWIETLGFTPNVLDPCYDAISETYRKYPLTRDPSTVEWWSHPERAEAAAQLETDVVDLAVGLERFAVWLESLHPGPVAPRYPDDINLDLRLWSHGENMDEPMLRMAYKALGLPVPWHYRSPRDTRTAFDLAGMDPTTCLNAFQTGGTFHNALDDAVTQARAVCHAYGVVAQWKRHDGEIIEARRAFHKYRNKYDACSTRLVEEVPGVEEDERFYLWHNHRKVWQGSTRAAGEQYAAALNITIDEFEPFEP